jgi:hypothetical protein
MTKRWIGERVDLSLQKGFLVCVEHRLQNFHQSRQSLQIHQFARAREGEAEAEAKASVRQRGWSLRLQRRWSLRL